MSELHPRLAELLMKYARDLGQVTPSPSLDARIERLVAATPTNSRVRARPWRRPLAWTAAAGVGVLAISAGIIIGVRLERSRDVATADLVAASTLASADLAMWPSDSVALTIPAEYSPEGTLVAVSPKDKSSGKRYWIDVIVSNDGTLRIERIVPADGKMDQQKAVPDGLTLQVQ
jgi:hypothetical protein